MKKIKLSFLTTFLIVLAALASDGYAADASETRLTIVDTARQYINTTDWAPDESILGNTRLYCNVFVGDVLTEAGAATWDKTSNSKGYPLASDWYDANKVIKGWKIVYAAGTKAKDYAEVLSLRQAGDIVACKTGNSHHVGIVSDEDKKTISASSVEVNPKIEHNNWSFRIPDASKYDSPVKLAADALEMVSRCTVRRFTGLQ